MNNDIERKRHSAAHIVAMAVQRLFPDVKLGVGPVTKQGFYHDFHFSKPIEWNDVKQIESEVNLIIQENHPFNQLLVPRDQAFEILMTRGQMYKSELLQDIYDEEVSFYKTGDEFIDLCRGPHIDSTNKVGAIKLLELSEVSWRNSTERPKLQRISGVVFPTVAELNQFLQRQQVMQERDFRRYLREFELTVTIGQDQTVYTPLGTVAVNAIMHRTVEQLHIGEYQEVILADGDQLDDSQVQMNEIFKAKNRSYRSLPYKIYGVSNHKLKESVYISDKPTNNIIQISAKSVFTPEDSFNQLKQSVLMCLGVCKSLGLKPAAQVHSSDLEFELLRKASSLLHEQGISQTQVIDANTPKDNLDIKFTVTDSLEREWDIIDLQYSARGPEFVNNTSEFQPAHAIAVEILIERILAFYLEDQAGGLPYWAAPVQAVVIPIAEAQESYAEYIAQLLVRHGIRTELDNRQETMQARIRGAELAKTPVIIVVGEKEEAARAVALRLRNRQEVGMISEQLLLETLQSYILSFSAA